MMFVINRRKLENEEERKAYLTGFNSFPRWPKESEGNDLFAAGYYDAERIWEEQMDHHFEEQCRKDEE